ncbi:MAG: hypothetical protein E7390_08090 [Ruminococcaceae bacterium]|nr:hypothetical protein [Oscillospiraceae bacterium]
MQKRSKKLCVVLLACLMLFNVAMATGATTGLRVEPLAASDDGIAPCFVAIWECARGLSLENSAGKLSVRACTDSYPGYTSGVIVLLQKKVGSSWVGVTSWEDAHGSTASTVDVSYYVSHGTYRTQCTHRAYYPSGDVAETFVAYSDEVTY